MLKVTKISTFIASTFLMFALQAAAVEHNEESLPADYDNGMESSYSKDSYEACYCGGDSEEGFHIYYVRVEHGDVVDSFKIDRRFPTHPSCMAGIKTERLCANAR